MTLFDGYREPSTASTPGFMHALVTWALAAPSLISVLLSLAFAAGAKPGVTVLISLFFFWFGRLLGSRRS